MIARLRASDDESLGGFMTQICNTNSSLFKVNAQVFSSINFSYTKFRIFSAQSMYVRLAARPGAFAVSLSHCVNRLGYSGFVLIVFQANCLTLIPLVCYSLISWRGVEQSGSSSGS